MRKSGISKASFDFSTNSGIFRRSAKSKGGAFEIADFSYFSNKEIHEKSRNFRNRDFATFPLSHFSRVFSLGAPAENLGEDREKTRISAALCTLHSTSENLHCGVGIRDSAPCTVHHGLSAFCALRDSAFCTKDYAPCTLHSALETLHSAPKSIARGVKKS